MDLGRVTFLNSGYCTQCSNLAARPTRRRDRFHAVYVNLQHPRFGAAPIDTGCRSAVPRRRGGRRSRPALSPGLRLRRRTSDRDPPTCCVRRESIRPRSGRSSCRISMATTSLGSPTFRPPGSFIAAMSSIGSVRSAPGNGCIQPRRTAAGGLHRSRGDPFHRRRVQAGSRRMVRVSCARLVGRAAGRWSSSICRAMPTGTWDTCCEHRPAPSSTSSMRAGTST